MRRRGWIVTLATVATMLVAVGLTVFGTVPDDHAATPPTITGNGISVALHGKNLFVVDSARGLVRQLDATSLQPIGDPLRYPSGLTGGVFDQNGELWLAIPDQGTLISVDGSTSGPRVHANLTIAEPGHDLTLSSLDDGVAVIDSTSGRLALVREGHTNAVTLDITGTAVMPTGTPGSLLAITVAATHTVYVFDGTGAGRHFSVRGSGSALAPGVEFGGRIYCADNATGTVYVLDPAGRLAETFTIPQPGGPLQLEVHGEHLFVNAPGSPGVRVVDRGGHVRVIGTGSDAAASAARDERRRRPCDRGFWHYHLTRPPPQRGTSVGGGLATEVSGITI